MGVRGVRQQHKQALDIRRDWWRNRIPWTANGCPPTSLLWTRAGSQRLRYTEVGFATSLYVGDTRRKSTR
jgi:hypothetical protein